MKRSKHLPLLFLMIFILAIGLIACSKPIPPNNTDETNDVETENPSTIDAPVNPTETTDETTVKLSDITALELTTLMGNGINLGNTLEAYGHISLGVDSDPIQYETLWGQPQTTSEMFTAMKTSGFDSVRIPVAWTNAMDFENGDYTIGKDYIDRVETIVGYALDADMYVIINDHWDGGWWGMFGSATQETKDQAMDLYISMWTQIAERFEGYSDKLIFESANEELGNRLNDMDIAKDSGTLSEDECYETLNRINQTFVNTIRNSGGHNAGRFLLIAGYNTDIEKTCDDRFHMPKDTIDNKLLLSVHYYTPWAYCGTESVSSWGTEKNHTTQNELLSRMTKYTDQGYGIVFGEYAVLPKSDSTLKDNTLDFSINFLDNCDLYGYVPMLWDTSSFFIRTELKIVDEDLSSLFRERSLTSQSIFSEEQVKENAKQSMDTSLTDAIENDLTSTGPILNGDEDAIAWIMFNSNDYAITYSVGDIYDPSSKTEGVLSTDSPIDSAGTYTVSLDFTGTSIGYAESTSFSALAISNGELLFPDYLITIKEIKINDMPYSIKGIPYTTSDNGICSRVNLYNGWVTEIPEGARYANPNMSAYLSATLLDMQTLGQIETLTVTFEYGPSLSPVQSH